MKKYNEINSQNVKKLGILTPIFLIKHKIQQHTFWILSFSPLPNNIELNCLVNSSWSHSWFKSGVDKIKLTKSVLCSLFKISITLTLWFGGNESTINQERSENIETPHTVFTCCWRLSLSSAAAWLSCPRLMCFLVHSLIRVTAHHLCAVLPVFKVAPVSLWRCVWATR